MPVLRTAVAGDLEALFALEQLAFDSDRLSRRAIRHAIAGTTQHVVVASLDGSLAGAAIVSFRRGSQRARLGSIAVAPACAGKGIGRALLAAIETEALRRGCQALALEVRADNSGAIALYRRNGFTEIARHPGYYADGMTACEFVKAL